MKSIKSASLRKLLSNLHTAIDETKVKNKHNISYERRTFIKNSTKSLVAVGASCYIPSFLTSCNGNNEKILDVAILGGGIAGLNCANHLIPTKLNFQVFEASKRLGGRILTHYNDSTGLAIFPEFGADFTDSNHNDILELADEFGLELIDLEKEIKNNNLIKDIFYFDNRKIYEAEVIQEFKKIAPKIAKDKIALGGNYDTDRAVELDNTSLYKYLHSMKCANWLKELLIAAFVAEFGLDAQEQSALNFIDLIETDTDYGFKVFGDSDEKYRIKGGNSKIIENLATKIGSDYIKTNYELTEINQRSSGLYDLKFANGEKVTAKYLVCTIPFTILRKIKLNIINMSKEKRKCIDELGYGINTKLILGFEGKPWREFSNAYGFMFQKEITNAWDSSYNKAPENPNNLLVCFYGGSYSSYLNSVSFKNKMAPPTHVWKTELPEKIIENNLNNIDKVFDGSKAKYLGKHVFVNWIDYPYAKGSYSCYKVGQWTSISGLEIEPVGNMFFAGEHCSEMFQGFMNGGAETGRRVAEEIKKLFIDK